MSNGTPTAPAVQVNSNNELSPKAKEHLAKIPTLSITRNGATLQFSPTVIKRGDYKDMAYPMVKNIKANLKDVITFIGIQELAEMLESKFALLCQNWFDGASDIAEIKNDQGVVTGYVFEDFDTEKFTKFVETFNARGETLGDLEDAQEKLSNEFVEFAMSPLNVEAGESLESKTAAMKDMAERINKIKVAIADKKASRTPRKPRGSSTQAPQVQVNVPVTQPVAA